MRLLHRPSILLLPVPAGSRAKNYCRHRSIIVVAFLGTALVRGCHSAFYYRIRFRPLLGSCPSPGLQHRDQPDSCYPAKRQAACVEWNVAFHLGSNSHYDRCLASQKVRLNRQSRAASSFTIVKELLAASLIGFLRRLPPRFHQHPWTYSAS